MKKIFFFFLLSFILPEIKAQQPITFERYYSDSGAVQGRRVRQTFDGGYIVAGRRNAVATFFSNDAILMKTDSLGDIEWLKVYGTSFDDDWFDDVQQTTDSGYIACGYIPQPGMQENIYVVKTDKNGDTLWTRAWGSNLGDICSSISQTYDGGYIAAGRWADSSGFLIKLDTQGDTIWTRIFYNYNGTVLYSVCQTADSGFVATGVLYAPSLNLNLEVYVVRVDKNGNTLWEKNYGYTDADYGFSIKELPDGNYIVGGYSWQPPNNYDSYLLKLNSSGDTLWSILYSDPRENGIKELTLCQDGGFAFAESKSVIGQSYQISLVKTDSLGNFLWRREFGGVESESTYGISFCKDSGFVLCGLTNSYGAIPKMYLVKTNELGIISGNNYLTEQTKNIKVDPNPFRDWFILDLKEFPIEKYLIEIYDILGNSVFRGFVTGNSTVQIEALEYLPSGTYFLQIKNNSQNYIIPIVHY